MALKKSFIFSKSKACFSVDPCAIRMTTQLSRGCVGCKPTFLKAMNAVKRLQENPELGAHRIHTALLQQGINLSPRTGGRILALNRKLYHLQMPVKQGRPKKEMPFRAERQSAQLELWEAGQAEWYAILRAKPYGSRPRRKRKGCLLLFQLPLTSEEA